MSGTIIAIGAGIAVLTGIGAGVGIGIATRRLIHKSLQTTTRFNFWKSFEPVRPIRSGEAHMQTTIDSFKVGLRNSSTPK